MASREKHKQRSARSYHKRSAEARSFARYVWWKNADEKTRKSLKDRAKDLIKKVFSRQKKGAQK